MAEDAKKRIFELSLAALNGAVNHPHFKAGRRFSLQFFDAQPDNDDHDIETEDNALGREEARTYIGERISSGFEGIAGACFFEEDGSRYALCIEAFHTRTNQSLALRLPLKRTMLGKFRPLTDSPALEGTPSIPGVFTSIADANREASSESEVDSDAPEAVT